MLILAVSPVCLFTLQCSILSDWSMHYTADMLQPVHLMFPHGFDWQGREVLAAQGLIEGGSNSICRWIQMSLFLCSVTFFSCPPTFRISLCMKEANKIKLSPWKALGFCVCGRAYAWMFSLIMTLGSVMCPGLCLSYPPPVFWQNCGRVGAPSVLWIWHRHCFHRASWGHGTFLKENTALAMNNPKFSKTSLYPLLAFRSQVTSRTQGRPL